MSQKVSRKSAVIEEKEKRQTVSPVKEMKKKMAANAEKEKQAAEKAAEKPAEKTADKTAKAADKTPKPAEKTAKLTEKIVEKPAEKTTKPTEKVVEKTAEKSVKPAEKAVEKPTEKSAKPAEKAVEKPADKTEKNEKPASGDKKSEKQTEKKSEPQAEKSKADGSKEDKSGKPEKADAKKPEPPKQKQNGRERAHNGVSDVTLGTNGTDDVLNGTVSADSEDDDVMLVIDDNDDNDQDELFPELTYEESSDVDCFELPTPENGPSRSFTRRSQVKATRTPETPRPASDKQPDKDADDPKDKVLKLKEDAPTTDRRLRSSNSPKPQEGKKPDATKKDKTLDSPKKGDKGLEKVDEGEEETAKNEKSQECEDVEIEVTVELPGNEGEELRKTDTNFSKSRVKVSPYRRSMRLADQTNTSLLANYTGNNTTMEMDISESSSLMEDAPLDDSSYLRGLRSIRGRSSYKPLKEITLRHVTANKSYKSAASTSVTSPSSESYSRPTGTVVGRKRKPDQDDVIELGVEVTEPSHVLSKRMRVLDRLAEPFRRVAAAAAMPTVARRNAEIVGINTDLPLTAPVASPDTFDPESLKPITVPAPLITPEPIAVPLSAHEERDSKRCSIMSTT